MDTWRGIRRAEWVSVDQDRENKYSIRRRRENNEFLLLLYQWYWIQNPVALWLHALQDEN